MANVTASMENVAKTTLWQSNESSYLNGSLFTLMTHYSKIKFGKKLPKGELNSQTYSGKSNFSKCSSFDSLIW